MTRRQQILVTVIQLGGALLFGLMAIYIYWRLEPPPYTLYERTLLTPRVEQGGSFKLQVKVRWTKTCYSKLFRNIIDSSGQLHPYEREVRPNFQGLRTFIIESRVPEEASVGPARWEVTTNWYCNPVQFRTPYVDVLDPIPFEIIPAKGKSP